LAISHYILVILPDADTLTPADPSALASTLAYALRFDGRKRVHNADEIMALVRGRSRQTRRLRHPADLKTENAALFDAICSPHIYSRPTSC
jgi:hypothetical protein